MEEGGEVLRVDHVEEQAVGPAVVCGEADAANVTADPGAGLGGVRILTHGLVRSGLGTFLGHLPELGEILGGQG